MSDYALDRVWRKRIVEMTPDRPGAPRVGTKVREVLRLGGRDYVTDATVTEAGPGLAYRFVGSGSTGEVRGRRSVEDGGLAGSAVFTYEVDLVPDGLPSPLVRLMGWWLRRSLRADLGRLRAVLEAVPGTTAERGRRIVT